MGFRRRNPMSTALCNSAFYGGQAHRQQHEHGRHHPPECLAPRPLAASPSHWLPRPAQQGRHRRHGSQGAHGKCPRRPGDFRQASGCQDRSGALRPRPTALRPACVGRGFSAPINRLWGRARVHRTAVATDQSPVSSSRASECGLFPLQSALGRASCPLH